MASIALSPVGVNTEETLRNFNPVAVAYSTCDRIRNIFLSIITLGIWAYVNHENLKGALEAHDWEKADRAIRNGAFQNFRSDDYGNSCAGRVLAERCMVFILDNKLQAAKYLFAQKDVLSPESSPEASNGVAVNCYYILSHIYSKVEHDKYREVIQNFFNVAPDPIIHSKAPIAHYKPQQGVLCSSYGDFLSYGMGALCFKALLEKDHATAALLILKADQDDLKVSYDNHINAPRPPEGFISHIAYQPEIANKENLEFLIAQRVLSENFLKGEGGTALLKRHIREGKQDFIEYLLEKGARPNPYSLYVALGYGGWSGRDHPRMNERNIRMAKLLLKHGADPLANNTSWENNFSAWDLAVASQNYVRIGLFKGYVASNDPVVSAILAAAPH